MKRPCIKPIHGVFFLDGRVRLGSGIGYAAEIDDPDGRYAALIRLLDGSRTVPDLAGELDGVLDAQELDEALAQLVETGYVEDAATLPPDNLSEDEIARYRANLNFFSTLTTGSRFAAQSRLKQLRVALIGLGGIGSNVAVALAELGVGAVTAIDFDNVELSNLNRQVLYSTSEVGEPKALAAQRRMNAFNPEVAFQAMPERIESIDDVRAFVNLAEPDVVFCLADKPNEYIDYWVNDVCVSRGIPMFAGSIFAAIGNAYCVLPGGPCYACRVDTEIEQAPQLAEEVSYIRDTGFNVSNGAMGPTCMFHAYFLVYEMMRHVLELSEPLTAQSLFEINFLTFEQSFTPFERRADCPVCGTADLLEASV